MTGAQINVSQESLPDSNERTVEIIGNIIYKLLIITIQ